MELLYIIIILLIYLNVSAIYYAVVSNIFSREQLIIQSLLVLLVPVLGGILILSFSLSQIDRTSFKPGKEKTGIKLLSYLFLSFLVSQTTSNNDSNPIDFSGSDSSSD